MAAAERAGHRDSVSISAQLRSGGLAVQEHFLAPAQVHALAQCAQLRRARGDFQASRIGGADSLQRRQEIRGDDICWLDNAPLPAEQDFLGELERLRLTLNRDALLGLFDLELHYACYPPGAGYQRHIDQPRGRSQRKVSLVLYLNEDWEPAAGGELRIFDAAGGHRDVEPIAGRLVCFLTAGREHEVRPTRRNRLSISGWFRSRD